MAPQKRLLLDEDLLTNYPTMEAAFATSELNQSQAAGIFPLIRFGLKT